MVTGFKASPGIADTQSLLQLFFPDPQLLVALGENLLHQLLQRLGEGGVGNVPLLLINFARDKESPLADDPWVQYLHQ